MTALHELAGLPAGVAKRVEKLLKAAPMLRSAVQPLLTGKVSDWHSEYAYSTGLQALIYGFPYIYNAQLRHKWVADAEHDPTFTPYAPVNEFWHARRLIDASYRDGGCPNNDTLYSTAWLDLSTEPVILSHPDMGERYFTFELMGIDSDNFDYVGQRATGSKAGSFAIVGPDWAGELPADVDQSLEHSHTPWILILGRTLVDGDDDAANVHELQDQYELTPLSRWGRKAADGQGRDVLEPIEPQQDPLGPFKTLNAMLAENPPPARHDLILGQFERIGIGPGLDLDAQPDAVKQGLIRAELIGMALLKEQFMSGDWANIVNGWRYPPPETGRYRDDFLLRAADQSLAGITTNDPAEAVYLVNFTDDEGRKLSGDSRYELRFAAADKPPADSFWSLALYGTDMNLVANPADRYSIGDRTAGLKTDADGGLTILLQSESPGGDEEANWLPTPSDGEWFLILRMYLPRAEVIGAKWECPPVKRLD